MEDLSLNKGETLSPGVMQLTPHKTSNEPEKSQQRAVHIFMAAPQDTQICHFWVGLFHFGKLKPVDLYTCQNIDEIFQKATVEGLLEQEPFMLSDTAANPPRYTYLVPEPGADQERRWKSVSTIVDTIRSWAPQNVGVYIAPELFWDMKSQEFLADLLGQMIQQVRSNDIFLWPGKHGLNTLINTVLELKEDFRERGVDLQLFH